MSELSKEELISAYHDGEVTPDEAARAERLLADDPDCRQFYDELRALSSTLKSLPAESLGSEFQEQVLRQAERRMLSPSESTSSPSTDFSRFTRWLRPLSYSAAAIAAALVIMVLFPDDGANIATVAEHPDSDKVSADGERTSGFISADGAAAAPPSLDDTTILRDSLELAPETRPESAVMSKQGGERPERGGRAGTAVDTLITSELGDEAPLDDGELLIVHLDAPRSAVATGKFETLLASNGIVAERLARDDPRSPTLAGEVDADTAETGDVEVIFVEATRSQVEQTLVSLAKKATDYRNLTVDPAPEVMWQQLLPQQFNSVAASSQEGQESELREQEELLAAPARDLASKSAFDNIPRDDDPLAQDSAPADVAEIQQNHSYNTGRARRVDRNEIANFADEANNYRYPRVQQALNYTPQPFSAQAVGEAPSLQLQRDAGKMRRDPRQRSATEAQSPAPPQPVRGTADRTAEPEASVIVGVDKEMDDAFRTQPDESRVRALFFLRVQNPPASPTTSDEPVEPNDAATPAETPP